MSRIWRQAPKVSSGMSVQSNRSIIRSLDRGSHSPRHSKHSFIEVMSIESIDRSPDIYEKLLMIQNEHERIDFEAIVKNKRKSMPVDPKFSIEEESGESSQMVPAPAKREAAVSEMVAEEEPKPKQKAEGVSVVKITCACEHTKCQKRYCSCYRAGMKCGRDCKCEQCNNYGRIEQLYVITKSPYLQDVSSLDMPQEMQFDPFKYRAIN